MLYSVEIGKNIVKLRCSRGITQEDLACGAGISVSRLRDIEHGYANPSLDILESIAVELRVPLPALFLLSMEDKNIWKMIQESRVQEPVEILEVGNGYLF